MKMKKKLVLVLALMLACSLVLNACAKSTTKEESKTKTAASTDAETDSKYPLEFDNYGRDITITQRPQKVLALGPNCTELLVALGLSDIIIGTSLRNHSRGPLPEYATQYDKIPELNHSAATREATISSGADFIYGIDWEFGDSGLDIDELETYGMTTYMNAATTVEKQYQEIRDIGKIFGVEEKAEAFIADQKTRISAVQDKISGQSKPNVLIYDSGNDGVFTCSGTNFESLLIDMAGGKNVFGNITEKAWVTVSYEEVLAREPDVIVIHDYDSPSVKEKIAEIKANDMLSQLECVKNERFVVIELESVLPGDRLAYSVEKLAKGFYPNLF
ncbi:MAG: ABC transporter substrate-binding protein [Clostridiales Family XIII bacterium]|jgi:iron complex transport system substrate-binding protein|nr:ABC transporter substrate-binding protein [Clostridiales Family XIII bacterium]